MKHKNFEKINAALTYLQNKQLWSLIRYHRKICLQMGY